jgi:parallel beta-helix repeat protein
MKIYRYYWIREENRKMKKKIIGIFVCMLLIMTVLPVSGNVLLEKVSNPASFGDTLYVGGSGEGNYTTIQSAINDASDGDSVFVYDESSPYNENLIVDVSINLIGEDKHMTVIDGNENSEGEADVIHIKADGVMVQEFTIQNGSCSGSNQSNSHCGIEIRSDNNIIKDNIIIDNLYGIQIGGLIIKTYESDFSNNNLIENNTITDNEFGLTIIVGNNNLISGNIISSNNNGMEIYFESDDTVVNSNIISLNYDGIYINGVKNIFIFRNTIFDNTYGISIEYSRKIQVWENNFYDNQKKDISLRAFSFFIREWTSNKIDSNYWGEDRQLPVIIIGKIDFALLTLFKWNVFEFLGWSYIYPIVEIPYFEIDWNPAQEPYDIGG